MAQLSKREKADAREIFAAGTACEHCGGLHQRACPRVKRLTVARTGAGDGKWTDVEYFERWDDTGIIWPDDAYDPDDPEEEDANG